MRTTTILSLIGVAQSLQVVASQKVFAHFMVQNSYSYTQADWTADINAAAAIGIDGFALNIAQNDYETGQLVSAFAAAESQGNFKLFPSFDMSYSWSTGDIVNIVSSHAASSAAYKWNGQVLVSTFSGKANGNSFYANVKSSLATKGYNITFAPALIDYRDASQASQMLSDFPVVDGFFNWWSWPNDDGNLVTADADLAFKSVVKKSRTGPYIMAVSPWQFKDLSGDGWVELSDTLIKYRWEQAINTVKPDIVEIVTWNDYGESHYIADINPKVNLGSEAPNYVNGMVHTPWQTVMQYYISWFKSGKAPTITTDKVVFWYRTHPKSATCSGGYTVRNSQYPADAIFALAMLASPATVAMDIGLNNHEEWAAPAGVSIGSVPFPQQDSQIPYIQIIRNGAKVKSGYGSAYITKSCSYYNFNPFVGVI